MELDTNLKEAKKGTQKSGRIQIARGKKAKHKAKEILLVGAVAF